MRKNLLSWVCPPAGRSLTSCSPLDTAFTLDVMSPRSDTDVRADLKARCYGPYQRRSVPFGPAPSDVGSLHDPGLPVTDP